MAARLRARVQAQPLTRHGSFQASEDLLQLACRSKPWPAWLQAEMRSNWAGETGAVAIYRGAVSALPRLEAPAAWSCPERAAALRGFVEEHLAAEEAHLRAMEVLCPAEGERSLLPATSFGWALGYVSTAAGGPKRPPTRAPGLSLVPSGGVFSGPHIGSSLLRQRALQGITASAEE
ncbi:unnamed protein product [Effrenium voratum]|nr:unnamed protein product [Effrenium voratum]